MNTWNAAGQTALMLAVAFGNNQTTSALLFSAADLGAVEDGGFLLVDYASVFYLGQVAGIHLENAKSSSIILH